ncbi:MAG: lipopolysaccharide core heptose(I) kinase RfaP [Pseudomonadaceae bacterium]|nr:lipopolysaccharide core heptose(I) kinase RfaP [Pseudomonadaceae bacterium]
MNELIARPELKPLLEAGDAFEVLMNLPGQSMREVASRSTRLVRIADKPYYCKFHRGVGWREIFKNLIIGRLAVVDANNERLASERLTAAGVESLSVAAFARRGANPATRESFLLTDPVSPALSLEALALCWQLNRPAPAVRRALIRRVAKLARAMHDAGVNHRDFYLCHLLLQTDSALTVEAIDRARLTIIDLHRAQCRERVPQRYLIRDLAGLHYSSMELRLSRADRLRFLSAYFNKPVRQCLAEDRRHLDRIDRRASDLFRKAQRKGILPSQIYLG